MHLKSQQKINNFPETKIIFFQIWDNPRKPGLALNGRQLFQLNLDGKHPTFLPLWGTQPYHNIVI